MKGESYAEGLSNGTLYFLKDVSVAERGTLHLTDAVNISLNWIQQLNKLENDLLLQGPSVIQFKWVYCSASPRKYVDMTPK